MFWDSLEKHGDSYTVSSPVVCHSIQIIITLCLFFVIDCMDIHFGLRENIYQRHRKEEYIMRFCLHREIFSTT